MPITIDPLAAFRPAQTDPFAAKAGDDLGRDSFLRLLTTQMQHQDPLDPMSNEEFVAQLAQFSSVEQLVGIRDATDAVYMGIAAMNNAAMAGLVGTEVVASGNGVEWQGEDSVLHWNAESDATDGMLIIRDEEGVPVRNVDLGSLSSGEGSWTWDGMDDNGQPVPDGTYTFDVSGTDTDGEPVDVAERIHGMITEMDYSSGTPMPSINGVPVSLADILTLRAAS